MTLKYLKETAIKWLDEQFKHPLRKIQWIVTVPAIWSDAAKEMMRKAAEKVKWLYTHTYVHRCTLFICDAMN